MLRLIFWLFILLLGLSFFGISIQSIINSPAGQANFGYVIHWVLVSWHWLTVILPAQITANLGGLKGLTS